MNVRKRTGYQHPVCRTCRWFETAHAPTYRETCTVTMAPTDMMNGGRVCRRMFDPEHPGPGSVQDERDRYSKAVWRYAKAAARWWREARVNRRMAKMIREELMRRASWETNPPVSVERMQLAAANTELRKLREENAELISQLATRRGH